MLTPAPSARVPLFEGTVSAAVAAFARQRDTERALTEREALLARAGTRYELTAAGRDALRGGAE